ncbi:unnamed protein product, partial [Nesidiocoris tenuis]
MHTYNASCPLFQVFPNLSVRTGASGPNKKKLFGRSALNFRDIKYRPAAEGEWPYGTDVSDVCQRRRKEANNCRTKRKDRSVECLLQPSNRRTEKGSNPWKSIVPIDCKISGVPKRKTSIVYRGDETG